MATAKSTLKITGMHCAGCVSSIENGLADVPGISRTQVNLALSSAAVEFDPSAISEQQIISKIGELGYGAELGKPDILTANDADLSDAKRRVIVAVLLAVPLMAFAMVPMLMGHSMELVSVVVDASVQGILAAFILFWAGSGILSDAWLQTRHGRANMNSLIALGALTAFGWSCYAALNPNSMGHGELYFESAGMIIALILLGQYFEARSRGKAGRAIQALMKLQPSKATAVFNNVEFEVDLATVRPGMFLRTKPGERIPADGIITIGTPTIDESLLTGESVPVEKKPGDVVVGGALNGNSAFTLKVSSSAEASYLSTVVRMVTEAQSAKAPIQALADKVAGIFTPIVIGIAVVTFIAWYLLAPDSPMLIKGVISVLIIACPCALGLATPVAVLAGSGRAAREGIIIRGGDILEKLARVDAVVFDKTGTLTRGELHVTDIQALNGYSEVRLKGILRAVEQGSEHPIGKAIVKAIAEGEAVTVADSAARPGFGITATVDGKNVVVGTEELLRESNVDLAALAGADRQSGNVVALVAEERRLIGIVRLADEVRPEAREVVDRLRHLVRQSTMLSGDREDVAREIAGSVGLDSFKAGIRPEQKRQEIETIRAGGSTVAMVGDGINDAPALAAADIGIAMGSGTDIAIESADVILLRQDLRTLPRAIDLSRKTLRIIKQNLFWAFIYNIIAIPLAAGAFYPVFGWSLSPMIAAAAMSFSSVFVALNSLRLNRIRLI